MNSCWSIDDKHGAEWPSTAVIYKLDSNSGAGEDKGVSVLTYKFKITHTNIYAVSFDMGARTPTC